MFKTMYWFNEPNAWKIIDEDSFSMSVTPQTDYWRMTHYGFTVDDGPFFYKTLGGEFEMGVKITGQYRSRYDQMGLMVRIDEQTWIKTGIEFVNEKMNLSAVVTIGKSDWSIIEMDDKPESVWLKIIRRLDSMSIYYSLDGKDYTMMRLAPFPDNKPIMAGITAASPDGDGFDALFEEFYVKHLPDQRRLAWLESHS